MNYEQFINYLSGWCAYRADFFKYLWPLKGGWEAWVQADFAAYIISTESFFPDIETIPIQREYPINNQRIDLFFGQAPENGLFVEIKCQSFGNWDNFKTGLTDDANKLVELQNVAAQSNVQIATALIGIGFEQIALENMLSQGFQLVHFSNEVVCGVLQVKSGNNAFLNNNQTDNFFTASPTGTNNPMSPFFNNQS